MPSEMKWLRELEQENARLKKIVADLALDKEMLQDVIKRMYGPPYRCKDLLRRRCSLRKCIRPLQSGLVFQPGHDEIRTPCFQIAGSGTKPAFMPDLQNADQQFRHHFRTSQCALG